jgi:tripartite-type tricarboxylate transporter receptor subunit TctC
MHPTTTRRTLIAALALAACTAAQAQAWPSKTLRIVVPYPPGGSSDIIARAIAPALGEAFGQTVVVENKPGANGNTGTDVVAKATTATPCCCVTWVRWPSPRRSTRSCRSTPARTCAA